MPHNAAASLADGLGLASRSHLLLGAALSSLASAAAAQQQDGQLWLQVNTNAPLADRVRVTLEHGRSLQLTINFMRHRDAAGR